MNKKGQLETIPIILGLVLFGVVYLIAETETGFSTKIISEMLPTTGFTSFIIPFMPFLVIIVDVFLIAFMWRSAFG